MAPAFATDEPAFSPHESAAESRRRLGRRGEMATARWYSGAGYTIVDRNWRCPAGEIDLVALEPGGSVVVICEVKTRSSTSFGSPAEAVTVAKQRRLRRLAALWLAGQRTAGSPRPTVRAVRFDVAAVMADRTGALVVEVVEDAF
jgi:putative endonuclease